MTEGRQASHLVFRQRLDWYRIDGQKKTPLQNVERGYPKNRLHLLFIGATKMGQFRYLP
jgi:hypothetical protein